MVDLLTSIAGRNSLSRHTLNNRNLVGEQQSNFWMKVLSVVQKVFPQAITVSEASMLSGGNLDEIREKVALDRNRAAFEARETRALTWTLDCLTTDTEFMQFIEGIPSYLNRRRNPDYQASQIIEALMKYDDYAFGRQHLYPFIHQPDRSERSMTAILDLISCLTDSGLFPYKLSHEENPWHGIVIPIVTIFNQVALYEDLSALDRKLVLRDQGCFRAVWRWVDGESNGYSHGELQQSLAAIRLVSDGHRLRSPDSPELKAALASCTLMSLCGFLFEEIDNLSQHFDIEMFSGGAIRRCCELTSFLAQGSSQEQQAYASATWFITDLFERHREKLFATEPWKQPRYFLIPLLQPLVNITDADALQTVRQTLASKVWWEDVLTSLTVLDQLKASKILRDPAIASIYWVKGLVNMFYAPDTTEAIIGSHLEQSPFNLTGLASELQNDFAHYISIFEITKSTSHRQLTAALFRLAGTLDDAKAATEAIKCLEKYIPQFDDLYQDLDQTKKAQYLFDAKEALEKLKQTAKEPGFVYKALGLGLGE
ncbi:hypothetical protein C8J56DRAFT_968122 [Mycena floridula]|nr:hypothetical protein C8J56DRAFT_968122 [Mycena floridula]